MEGASPEHGFTECLPILYRIARFRWVARNTMNPTSSIPKGLRGFSARLPRTRWNGSLPMETPHISGVRTLDRLYGNARLEFWPCQTPIPARFVVAAV